MIIVSLIYYAFLSEQIRYVMINCHFSDDNSDDIGLAESLQYDFETIRSATDDFSDANKLGQGGFGAVYKVTKHYITKKNNLLKNCLTQLTFFFSL